MPTVSRARPSPWGDRRRVRIGVLGGSFNPAHEGHGHISQEALARLRLNAVWWLVSPHNPLKPTCSLAPLATRLASACARTAHDPRLVPLTLESAWGTYRTADTVRTLRQRFPRVRFVWLMGADNLAQFPLWHHWMAIARGTPIAVLDRAPYSTRALMGKAAHRLARYRKPARMAGVLASCPGPAWVFLPIRRHGASATALRARGEGWVPSNDKGMPRTV
ncbi:nicotinate-nucleotide adenylyltransferase [Pararhodospirillum oryzae]|uniref:nicotinate-nucleotide adenylyltransferase n=1 Tax=Pararhodospirillum oryzae TaxID=478448 RepID=A0A512HA75_9PROT|nr:nicotinate-nucleotide adenylyltransferase [Pararhodospirillum oryzae]GEO82363.1 putative nicotinate-nucleotide adenylyltransferase [Pararhodospirillum oryzae]